MDRKEIKRMFAESLLMTLLLIAIVLGLLAFSTLFMGCKGKERIVYSHHTDSVYISRVDTFVREVEVFSTDTIKLRDSVFIERINTITLNESGDTIYRDRIVFRDRWHDTNENHTSAASSNVSDKNSSTDTSVKSDTIYVRQEVEKSRTLKERVADSAGWLAFALLLVCGVLYVAYKNKK